MENNGGYNMKKKLILPILAISLAAYAPVTNAYASYSNNCPRQIIQQATH